ncbi:MAG: CRISPR-associated endonuclease Cas2 [Saprospiraceae bacterium]|nr:CRISPR-associated endonuclease Cas2 [Saprospiraceae bacterium]
MNNSTRFNSYRIMWLMVYFDLPTETKLDKKSYANFRKNLLKAGFKMFQFSIYVRHCMSVAHAEKYKQGVKKVLPEKGHIVITMITDRQFGDMEIYHGPSTKKKLLVKMPELEFF